MAKRTGVSVEALSTLSYAAKLSDTSIESVQGGLMKMAKLMGEVRSGSAQAAEKLQALGLSTTQMLAANPEQQLKMVADAIAGIADPSQQAAAAMEIFGKGAGDLLPLLQMGGKGIEYMQQKGISGRTRRFDRQPSDLVYGAGNGDRLIRGGHTDAAV